MATPNTPTCIISCHCGASRQTVELDLSSGDGNSDQVNRPGGLEISVCHCYACRHVTGQMFASWLGIRTPEEDGYGRLKAYAVDQVAGEKKLEAEVKHWFCGICGCHVFRSLLSKLDPERQEENEKDENCLRWEVATGVIIEDSLSGRGRDDSPGLQVQGNVTWRHVGVDETKDGGLFTGLSQATGHFVEDVSEIFGSATGSTRERHTPTISETPPNQHGGEDDEELKATCHCKTISLSIARPEISPTTSKSPRSNFPDLMYPYISTPQSVISNPDDVKWWLRGLSTDGFPTRYLAGTCACRSCRLTSGFEIQSWAFIPRRNIRISVAQTPDDEVAPGPGKRDEAENLGPEKGGQLQRHLVPLVFPASASTSTATLPDDSTQKADNPSIKLPLQSYESSPGVVREFCPVCGVTVFWHDKWRPDLMDVSVGLFKFPGDSGPDSPLSKKSSDGDDGDGARHESWLDWWTERVSFAEDAGLDRSGLCSLWGKELVSELERGLKENNKPRVSVERERRGFRGVSCRVVCQ